MQVVTLATHTYFFMALFARQYLGDPVSSDRSKSPTDIILDPRNSLKSFFLQNEDNIAYRVDYCIPFFTLSEFVFIFGWFKLAQVSVARLVAIWTPCRVRLPLRTPTFCQVMINPFGMDDDDFEIDALIERNLAVSEFSSTRVTLR